MKYLYTCIYADYTFHPEVDYGEFSGSTDSLDEAQSHIHEAGKGTMSVIDACIVNTATGDKEPLSPRGEDVS